MSQLKMLDFSNSEFVDFYFDNKNFISNVDNYFYLKNDKQRANDPSCVVFGKYNNYYSETKGIHLDDGAAVLYCNSNKIDTLRKACEKEDDGLVRFKLKNRKTSAYVSVIKNIDGKEYVGLVIKNNPKTIKLPYSKQGHTNYQKASKEDGTLPNMVKTGKLLDLIPDKILNLCGLEKSKQAKIQEVEEIDKKIAELNQQLKKLQDKKSNSKKGKSKED